MKRKLLYILGGIIAFLIIIVIIAPKPEQSTIQNTKQDITTQETNEPTITDSLNSVNTKNVNTETDSAPQASDTTETINSVTTPQYYSIVSVVDGDTIKISVNGETKTFRLIGMDTPETVDPRKPVQCFGIEASNIAKELLSGRKVRIETDTTQGTYDKYNRLLGYVYREDGLFYNKYMIEQGYAHEYTYDTPYKYQTEFKDAQKEAQDNERGLWSPNTCSGDTTSSSVSTIVQTDSTDSCNIKGNISSGGKIYHMTGCGSYNKTVIDESKGEKWFCSEQEALDAGWRKALNCN